MTPVTRPIRRYCARCGRPMDDPVDHWIGGRSLPPRRSRYLEVRRPGETRARSVARGDAEDVDAAVRSASRAQPAWGAVGQDERGRTLAAIARALREQADELTALERAETGKPLAQAAAETAASAEYFDFYAGAVRFLHGETMSLHQGQHVYTRREPYGVVGVITPWNYPLNQAARAVAPAIAAGNSVVLKPSELTPGSSVELARLARAAGLAPGVLNVVAGTGEEAGEALVSHPLVNRLTFTGSTRAGRRVAQLAAERFLPLTLELGGKSPCIVFADADLASAALAITGAFVENAGQTCSAPTRLLVERTVEERLLGLVGEALERLVEGEDYGPIITEEQKRRIDGVVAEARAAGARVVYAGQTSAPDAFVAPVVLAGVDAASKIAQEEIFGPVLVVVPFDSEDEAVAIANGTRYGLVAGLWTGALARAHRVAARLEAGQVYVNTWSAPIDAPFGGYKASGYGREKGRTALEEYTRLKSISIDLTGGARAGSPEA
jgi:aldehyde dehydrogenase (NAD+)